MDHSAVLVADVAKEVGKSLFLESHELSIAALRLLQLCLEDLGESSIESLLRFHKLCFETGKEIFPRVPIQSRMRLSVSLLLEVVAMEADCEGCTAFD